MAHGFTVTAVLAILLVCIPLSLANDPPSGQPSGLPQQSQAVPGSQLRNNATSPSSVDQQPSNQAPSRASPPLQAELFAHSPAESPPSLNDRQSASTANAPASQPSAEPPAQQLPQLSSPPQAPPAGSRTEPSSDARNNAPAAPAFPEAAPPLSPAGGETVSGAPAQEKGGAEASREEAEQLSTTCGLTDYIRQSGACDSKGRRTVSFVKARNCTDPFPVQPSQQEPCTCTPEDFDVVYTASRDGATCNMQYLPRNCTGAQQSQLIPVDKVYCGLPNAPCTEAHVDAIYSDCDFIRDSLTGLNISAMRFVEVRPGGGAPWGRCTLGEVRPGGGAPWGRCTLGEVHPGGGAPWGRCTLSCSLPPVCSSLLALSVLHSAHSHSPPIKSHASLIPLRTCTTCPLVPSFHSPSPVYSESDMQCGAGHYLHHDHCHKCPAGTYSMGGKWRFQDISEIDPLYFKVHQRLWHLPLRPVRCPSALTAPHHLCCPCAPTPPMPPYILSSAPPWYADDGAFEAGAYDYINDWLPEVCASDPAYNCHNNLLSSLSLDVHLVRDGYVRYVKFNFPVSAEVGHGKIGKCYDSSLHPLISPHLRPALHRYVKFNFTVSAEVGHDGLAFYIDSLSQPLMALTSYQFEPREMVFPVEAGQHRLVWVYSKDDKWSKGEDIATIPVSSSPSGSSPSGSSPSGSSPSGSSPSGSSPSGSSPSGSSPSGSSPSGSSPSGSSPSGSSPSGSSPSGSSPSGSSPSGSSPSGSSPSGSSPSGSSPSGSPPSGSSPSGSSPSGSSPSGSSPSGSSPSGSSPSGSSPSGSAEGAGACEPCPENTISKEGASECTACGSSAYARIVPRTDCKPRLPCSLSDSTITYTPCQLASKKRIMKWQWIQPQICDPSNITLPMDMPLDCEPCPDGQQAEPDPQSGEIRCTLCPPASYEGGAGSAGSMLEGRCEACSEGQVAMKTLSLKHFTMQPNGALPPNFTTGCHGDCGTFGWRAFQDHLDSGSGHGPTASVRNGWIGLLHALHHEIVIGHGPTATARKGGRALWNAGYTSSQLALRLVSLPNLPLYYLCRPWRPVRHQIWLALDVHMAVRGYMTFNYSVDILPGDPGRAFFFFIDHDLMDYVEVTSWTMWSHCSGRTMMTPSYSSLLPTAPSACQQQRVEWEEGGEESGHPGSGEEETRMSGIWELDVGRHSLMWVWQKLDDTGAATRTTRDSAVIYDIHIEGVAEGGAARCEEVPQGTTLAEGGDSYVPCPPGTSSEGGASSCLPCPPNTFNNQPQGAQWACNPCGAGTSSLAGSTECFIGDATRPASFCTFSLPLDSIPRRPYLGQDGAEEQAGQEGQRGEVGEGGTEGGERERGVEGEAGRGGASPPGGSGTVGGVTGNGTAAAVVFDLSPLSRMHPGRMFGPVLDAAADPDGDAAGGGEVAEGGAGGGGGGQGGSGNSKARGQQAAEYFVSVCDRDSGNDTCYDYSGRSLNTYACKVHCVCPHSNRPHVAGLAPGWLRASLQHSTRLLSILPISSTPPLHPVDPREARSGARPGHNLGSAVAVYPLAAVHAGLYRRGLVMAFTGDECPQTNMPRETNLTFICDPAAGPEAWTKEGQMAALNPVLGYPQYSQRGGAVQRIEHSDCSFSLVWYSLFACPLCSHEDYERVETAECMDETRATFKWKLPRVCQLNPFNPLPQDEPCEPCKPDDIIRSQGDCADANGNHNITYSWRQPHHCSPTLPGAASLPAPELVGPCEQRWVYVPSEALSPMWIALFVGLTVLIVGFGYLSLVTWLRSRRLRQMYQRLVEAEVQMEGDMVLRAAAFGGPAGRKTGMGVGDALVIQTALSVTLASAARRAGWIRPRTVLTTLVASHTLHTAPSSPPLSPSNPVWRDAACAGSYHPERIGNENVRKAVDVALWVGDGITALGCAVIDAVKKMAGRGGNRLGRR
ncbi:unnamed protein product [Closterium sp. NIES-64]|nr:unnamed protein product [Closterium sp. NIES-64]